MYACYYYYIVLFPFQGYTYIYVCKLLLLLHHTIFLLRLYIYVCMLLLHRVIFLSWRYIYIYVCMLVLLLPHVIFLSRLYIYICMQMYLVAILARAVFAFFLTRRLTRLWPAASRTPRICRPWATAREDLRY